MFLKCNIADTVNNTLKRCLKKNCYEYIYVHNLDFPLMRERERERERERADTLAHDLCFDAFVDVFLNKEFKISL